MELDSNENKIADRISEVKESNLKVGDVLLVMTKTSLKSVPSDNTLYHGVISADGMISKSVSLIPKDGPHGANIQTRSCLFRIENARKINMESESADSELLMALGKSLTYGERVQLRHWHSKGFLAVNPRIIAAEAGCLEMYISDEGNEDSWFEIQPVNKLRKSGEVIKYTDSLYLKCGYEKSAYYLHFNEMNLGSLESKTEVNACGNFISWRLKKYMSYDLSVNEGVFVTTGDSFRIFHKISEGYLSVSESQILTDQEFHENPPELKIFVQKGNKSSNSLWELQRLSTFIGGIAMWQENFRIKHLATGQFLAKADNTLVLTPRPDDKNSTFELVPQSITAEKEIRFGIILTIRNSKELLKVDYQEELTSLIQQKSKESYQMSFVQSKKDYSTVAFVIEDVPEANTAHVYKLSLMVPTLIDTYFYLKTSDLNPDFLSENPEKETVLKQTCEQVHMMFGNIRKYVLHSNISEIDVNKRQGSMREMGIIDALIKLADLVQYKIQTLVIAPILERDSSKFSYRTSLGEEFSCSSSTILYLLEEDIYQLIYDSIKNNPKNCKGLREYEDKIIPMLSSKSFQKIGKILREMFKFVLTLSNYSEKRINKLFEFSQKIRFGDGNIKNQCMYYSIIKHLNQTNKVSSVHYQAHFKDGLFGSESSSRIIKLHICKGRPCIELDYNRKDETLSHILESNRYLSSLELVQTDDLLDLKSDLAIFYLEDLCKDKDYSKYISSAIDFYSSLCFGRYNEAIEKITTEVNASPEYMMLVLNSSISDKLKSSFIDFMRTVLIDIDPYIPISHFKSRCYSWIDTTELKAIKRMDKDLKPKPPDYFYDIGRIVSDFWASEQKINLEDLNGQLKLTTSYLRLTKTFLDLEVLKAKFIPTFQVNLLYLIMNASEINDSWCNLLVRSIRNSLEVKFTHSLEAKLSEMLEEVMDILNIMIIERENVHIDDLCLAFFNGKTHNADVENSVNLISPRNLKNHFQSILAKREWNIETSQKLESAQRLEGTQILDGAQKPESALKLEMAQQRKHLDIYLLNLLFNSDKNINKEVRKKALELILADLNMRSSLKKELESVEFLSTQAERDLYIKIYTKSKAVYAIIKNLITLQAERNMKGFYNTLLKEASVITLDLLQLFKSESHSTCSVEKFQSILRHTNILEPLIAVLELKTNSHKVLYRNSINLLYAFACDSIPNQSLLLQHVDLLLSKIEIGLGVTKLLAQVLSRNSQIRKGNKVIKLIFESIDQHSYEYHLLQLLRTFVYDEKREIAHKMQIDILKWIFNNRTIRYMHTNSSNYYDCLTPKLPSKDTEEAYKSAVKFHIEVMKCINACISKNRFGILQGRKLISMRSLMLALKKDKINPYFKKNYLKFMYEVYMTEIPGSVMPAIDINTLEDLLKDVVLKDLENGLTMMDVLVSISTKGLYPNIPCRRPSDFKIRAFMQIIAATNPSDIADDNLLEAKRVSKLTKLTEEETAVLEHWNYLSGGQAWHSQKDGLLHILRDIFMFGPIISEEIEEIVNEIRLTLKTMIKRFEELEKKNKNLDFSTIILIINACREAMPMNEDEEIDNFNVAATSENAISLIFSLREAILERKLSLDEVFAIFDTDKNGKISKVEFSNGFKSILKIQSKDIETCYNYFASDGELRIAEFSSKLRKYFFRRSIEPAKAINKALGKGAINFDGTTEDTKILKDFTNFILDFSELCKNQDIHELVDKIKDSFVDPAIKKNDHSILKEFVTKLGTAFKKKIHKIYLLQILTLLIPANLNLSKFFDDFSKEQQDQLENIRKTQEILSKSGVLELALTIISSEHELELVEAAVQLLIHMLNYGNQIVQEKFLGILKLSDNSYLFSYIRLKLRQSRDRIVDRARVTYEKNPEKAMQGKVLDIELEQNDVFIECAVDNQTPEKAKHVESLILLLQLCCENCYSAFQHYIRSQEVHSSGKKAISINMVNEIAQYLINIKEVGPELVNDEEALMIIPQCYETLIDLCTGPCFENQLILGQRRKLYKFIDNIINEKKFEDKFFECAVRFLKVLLEGDLNTEIAKIMIEEINFKALAEHAFDIYQKNIHEKRDSIIQENVDVGAETSMMPCKMVSEVIEESEWRLINTGFDIVIIFLKLRDKFPDSSKLKHLSFKAEEKNKVKPLLDRIQQLGGRQEGLFQGIIVWAKSKFRTPDGIDMDRAYEFYLSLLASVEIDREGTLEQSYFRVPAMIVFLSEDMRNKILYQLNRNSHEEKVKSVFQHSELCQLHMHHLQQLSKFKTLTWWSSKSKSLADISFVLIVFINLILLFSISSPSDNNFNIGTFPGQVFLTIFGVIVIILSISVYLMFILENFPIILYENFTKPKKSDIYNLPSANKLQGTVLIKYYAESTSFLNDANNFQNIKKVLRIFLYPENIYNLFYILLVCVAWKTVFVYPFLLLDIVRRNENLRNILKAVTQNQRQLGLTVLLGLIIVYLFGVIGFLEFSQYYNNNSNGADCCDSLLSYVTYTLYYGVRAGGGVGDGLQPPLITDYLYGARQFFDLAFFIIVIIILLNIIFGIIIDTFGELRDKRKQIEEDIENICIICGREKYEFELRGSGWNKHIQLEHNLFSYLAYIISVRRKPISECDGLEKYVKYKINEGDVSFLPKTAMCLEKGEQNQQDTMLKEINDGIKDIEELIEKIELADS